MADNIDGNGKLIQSLTLALVALIFGGFLVNLINPPKPPPPPKVEVHSIRGSNVLSDFASITVIRGCSVRVSMGDDDRFKVRFETAGTINIIGGNGADYSVRDEQTGSYLTVSQANGVVTTANSSYTITMQCPKTAAREIMLIAN